MTERDMLADMPTIEGIWKGTVIEGTHRKQDLIPRFVDVLSDIVEQSTLEPGADHPERVRLVGIKQRKLGGIEGNMAIDGYYTSDQSDTDIEWLFDSLNSLAPEGFYFGAHHGDGADFGFWPSEEGGEA
jgi:hypothetical protein